MANATLKQIAEEKIGTVKTSTDKPWISNWDIVLHRNDLKTKLISDGSLWPDYREAAKRVKKAARNDKRKYMDNLASDTEASAETNNMSCIAQTLNKPAD